MLKLSACIDMLYRELDFYDRFAAAKKAGLDAVEFWGFPGRDLARVREECDKNELTLAAACVGGTVASGADVPARPQPGGAV